MIKAFGRFEHARGRAFRRSLRHPDGASLFVALLAGLVLGSAAVRDIHASLAGRVAAGIGIGLFVAFCIYGAGAGLDAVAELSRERADGSERDDRGRMAHTEHER